MIQGLPPISRKNARILILGSMPGKRSLELQQYYAHPQNAFWKIMAKLTGDGKNYGERTLRLKKHRIALWDVIRTCRRKGSLDSAIRQPRFNDLESFLRKHPEIRHIFLNGSEAYRSFTRYADGRTLPPHTYLPSTSPAHTMSFQRKLNLWKGPVKLRLSKRANG
jgi:hypoxanthine-DNA glycosylase